MIIMVIAEFRWVIAIATSSVKTNFLEFLVMVWTFGTHTIIQLSQMML